MKKNYNIEENKEVIWYEENGFRISFPMDKSNPDYQAYLKELTESLTPVDPAK